MKIASETGRKKIKTGKKMKKNTKGYEILENVYIGLYPSYWHRAPKNLVISWVIGLSFVLIR